MSNTHEHCFCIKVKAQTGGTSGIGIGITQDHQKCCMCMQQRVATNPLAKPPTNIGPAMYHGKGTVTAAP